MMNIVYVTCKDEKEASFIARILIKEKLAACTNIIPKIKSIYRWEGKVEEGDEAVLIIKTLPKLVEKVFTRVKQLHSYDCPEMISWIIDKTTPQILNWLEKELI